jgi:hypothetical protein
VKKQPERDDHATGKKQKEEKKAVKVEAESRAARRLP